MDRCQTAMDTDSPDLPPLLHTLAQAAQSPASSAILLDSLFLPSTVLQLTAGFTQLASRLTTSRADSTAAEGAREPVTSPSLARLCSLLAFLTDLSRNWSPAKAWLGGRDQRKLWAPLVQFLSLGEHCPHLVSSLEISFCQDVACEFFQAILQGNTENKTIFSRLLTNALHGHYSTEERGPADTSHQSVLTPVLYRLLVDIVLTSESLLVILQPPEDHRAQRKVPCVPLSLPHTYDCPHFHPSFPVSQHSCYLSLSLSSSPTAAHLLSLCQAHQQTKDTGSKVTVKKPPPSEPVVEMLSMKSFEFQRLHPLQPPVAAGKSEPRSILKGRSQPAGFSLFLPTTPQRLVAPDTSLLELLAASPSPCHALLLTIYPFVVVPRRSKTDGSDATPLPPPSSPSHAFMTCGGLQPLALSLPSLYPHHWPGPSLEEEEEGEEEEEEEEGEEKEEGEGIDKGNLRPSKKGEEISGEDLGAVQQLPGVQPFSLLHVPSSLPLHAFITFGLCLKLPSYGAVLLSNPSMACVLLRTLLGAETRGM